MVIEGIWLKHPKTGNINLVVHEDTLKRCLSEGHMVVPDPRLPVEAIVADPDAATAPVEPVDALAPQPLPEAPPAASDEAQAIAVQELNDAARVAFGEPRKGGPRRNTRH